MAGTSRMDFGPAVAPPPFLKRLLHATQRGRGLSRVMVATDFSMCSDLALARALRLPMLEGASLTLFHASPERARRTAGDMDMHMEDRCLGRVAGAARRRLRAQEPVTVKEALRTGDVVEEASVAARLLEVELVVAGRPHAARSGDETRGATVRGLVRRLEAPLLVVGMHPSRPYQRPLVAVDLSEDSRRALELTLRLCPPPVGIDVVHVTGPCATSELLPSGMRTLDQWLAVQHELEQAARKAVSRFIAPYREAGRECEISIRCGEPLEQALLREAAERGADLLALGMRASEGSAPPHGLAERMAMRAGCDVLVAKLHALE